ncbi:oligopeptide transporter [Musa troglodytarum]|uniref:Oligopeptide transporter n=1 Tax=Musa troglodytarum TaxID=320322 RepID=A0A9E7KAL7_9LILI|nr:oligopeptide transporter [Musa troglodytarum]
MADEEDDNTLQVVTFRTWLIGLPICILGSVIAALSAYRQQLFYLPQVCVNIIALIVRKLMANTLPNKVVRMPYTNWSFSLNPGPFNERTCGDHHTGRHGRCFCRPRHNIHVQDLLPQGYPITAGHAAGAIGSGDFF